MKFTRFLRVGAIAVFSVALANAGVTYTCAPNITVTISTLCNTLNTTTAALYTNTFSNVNASIYIEFGSTDLGENVGYLNYVTYSQFVAALGVRATASGNAVLAAAVTALNTYAAPIYGGGMVELSTALARNLGFTSNTVGINAAGTTYCTNLGGSGCYDGVITITNDKRTVLYYRTGTEPSNAFDFFGVVEHETDEVLGTASCIDTTGPSLADDCDFDGTVGVPSAVDLFRYSAAGKIIADSSLSTTPGAYFSYNGGATNGADGAVYNTLDYGDDYGDFVTNCSSRQHIQDAEACAGEDANIDITNDGGAEINILNAVGYTLPMTVSTLPVISPSGVVAHGGKSTTIEPGAFIDIYGTNLSPTTQTAAFNGNFPTTLDNVEVMIDGKSAYVYYVSSGLINVQAPDDTALGTVNVTVTNSVGTSAAVTATLGQVGPTFFTLDGKYVAGVIPASSGFYLPGTANSYDLLGPSGLYSFNTRPAKKGEVVELYASGFGAGTTPVPAGKVDTVAVVNQTVSSPVTVMIGGVAQKVPVYITGAGLWQMNVTIPLNAADGDNALQAIVDGVTTPTGVFLTVQ